MVKFEDEISNMPLTMYVWKTILSFWDGPFSGAMYLSFREGAYLHKVLEIQSRTDVTRGDSVQ